jgi:transcriptional regulator with XRE-family HTH domain
MTDLSSRIRQAVERSGKTQRQIADAIGITEVSLSRYVHGERTPRATSIPKLAEACGVSVEWLQTGKEPYTSHIEMIIDYTTDGTDYQYCDNHGILIRCRDCAYWHINCMPCAGKHGCDVMSDYTEPDFYCGSAVRRTKNEG